MVYIEVNQKNLNFVKGSLKYKREFGNFQIIIFNLFSDAENDVFPGLKIIYFSKALIL